MTIPADFSVLWANLPQWFHAKEVKPPPGKPVTSKMFGQIPGMAIPKDWETCCIQMSFALNSCGRNINYGNLDRIVRDAQGRQYMLDVEEMRGYLEGEYGAPETIDRIDAMKHVMPRWLVKDQLRDRQGILAFGGRHIDLWEGRKIHGKHYIESEIWEHKTTIADGLFFWDVG